MQWVVVELGDGRHGGAVLRVHQRQILHVKDFHDVGPAETKTTNKQCVGQRDPTQSKRRHLQTGPQVEGVPYEKYKHGAVGFISRIYYLFIVT